MQVLRSSKSLVSGSAVLLLLVTGCSPSKVAQCNDFIEVSNELGVQGETFGTELEAELQEKLSGQSSAGGPPDFGAIATDLNTAADTIETKASTFLEESTTKLSAVELQDETLQGYQTSYVDLINTMGTRIDAMAEAVRGMADIFEEIDPSSLTSNAQVEQLQASLGAAEENVNATVAELDSSEIEEDALIAEINAYCGAEE